MQAHGDFIFHLDEPCEQFEAGKVRLRGWITARGTLTDLRLCGNPERELHLEERPDVRRAFPAFSFATGFVGEIAPGDLRDGELHFSFVLGGLPQGTVEHLAAAPPPLPWFQRTSAKARRWLELQRLRLAREPRARWKAALSGFLLQIKITRGGDFHRQEGDQLIALFAEHFPDAFVVQIGANDGLAADPLVDAFSRTRWSALLIEPVPYFCQRLAHYYRDRPGIRIEQAAVSTRDGEAPLYRLRTVPGETPEWYGHLATLNREVLLQHRSSIPEIDSLLVEERTPTVRLDTLFARHRVERIDLLVIDSEGHDFEIVREFDFARFKPLLLMFEHQHLSSRDKAAAYELLQANGYTWKEMKEGDAIAWRKI